MPDPTRFAPTPRRTGLIALGGLALLCGLAGDALPHASAQTTRPAAAAVPTDPLATQPTTRSTTDVTKAADERLDLTMADAAVPEVLARISKLSRLPVVVSPGTYELLPWGRQTTLPKVEFKNQTVGDALGTIAQRLGLTVHLEPDQVELIPMPALARLGRTSTLDELATLDLLSRRPMPKAGTGRTTVKRLVDALDATLGAADADAKAAGREPPRVDVECRATDGQANGSPDTALFVPRNATAAEALEAMDRQTRLTWLPRGKTVVVMPRSEQYRDRLARTVNLKYDNVDVAQVLTDLSAKSAVPFRIYPGAVQAIPATSRNVKILLENATVDQALQNLAGVTGLSWSVDDRGVFLWNKMETPPAPDAAVGGKQAVGILKLSDGMDLLIFENEVPDDLRKLYASKKAELFEKQRREMKAEQAKKD